MEQLATQSIQSPDIFAFLNYREFLQAYYNYKKSLGRGFSYRVFSRIVGMNTPTYMKMILSGERNLSTEHIAGVAKACQLDDAASKYFQALVLWNQEIDSGTKELYWSKLLETAAVHHVCEMSVAQVRVLTKWYILAILEMTRLADFNSNPEWIQARFRSTLSTEEIQKAIETLVQADLLSIQDGKCVPTNKVILKSKTYPCDLTRTLHAQLLKNATEAVTKIPHDKRQFSSSMFGIKKENLPALKEEIRKFQVKILQTYACDADADEVVQLLIAGIPLTK